jgi:hypothetical protein
MAVAGLGRSGVYLLRGLGVSGIGVTVDRSAAWAYHDEVLYLYMTENVASFFDSLEVVGALNQVNGTVGVEYWSARNVFLGLPPDVPAA